MILGMKWLKTAAVGDERVTRSNQRQVRTRPACPPPQRRAWRPGLAKPASQAERSGKRLAYKAKPFWRMRFQKAESGSSRCRVSLCVASLILHPASGRPRSARRAVLTAPWCWALALRQNTFWEAIGRDTPNRELSGHAAQSIRTHRVVGIFTALHQRSRRNLRPEL